MYENVTIKKEILQNWNFKKIVTIFFMIVGGQEGDDLWVEVTADQNSVSTANRHPLAEFSSKPLIVQKSPPEVSSASIKSTVPISGVKIQVPQLPAAAELSVREFFQSEQIAFNQRLAARSLKKDK